MGFPSVPCGITIPNPLLDLLEFLNRIKFLVSWILCYFGLLDTPVSDLYWHDRIDHFPATDPASITPSPANAALIKKRLPVVEFGRFVPRFRARSEEEGEEEEEEEEAICAVCLCCLETSEEVRELCNCCHVFHRGCLDKWVDQGQTTCPLCRSELLPEKDAGNKGGETWVVDRISYLFGEDLVRGGVYL